ERLKREYHSIRQTNTETMVTVTWADFKKLFFLQFFPRAEQERLKREYHSIRQTITKTSTEFMKRFLRLAGFLGAAAGTEEEQAKNFQWGLRRSTLNHLMCMSYTNVAQVANAARNYEILHERDDEDTERPDKRRVVISISRPLSRVVTGATVIITTVLDQTGVVVVTTTTAVTTTTLAVTTEGRYNYGIRAEGFKTVGSKHLTCEDWISHMEKIFDVMGCEDAFKTRLAVYKFEDNALAWWKAYKQTKGGDAWLITVFPSSRAGADDDGAERLDKRQKNGDRHQPTTQQSSHMNHGHTNDRHGLDRRGGSDNRSSNNNYSGNNNRSSGNGRDQRNRGQQSNRSVNFGSQQSRGPSKGYSYPVCTTCGHRHPGECHRAAGTCFKCGQTDHLQKDCKKNTAVSTYGQGDKKPGASGRVFDITKDHATKTSGTITVTLFIYGHAVFVLFDMGATRSVISSVFASCVTTTPTLLDHVLCIISALQERTLLYHGCEGFLATIHDTTSDVPSIHDQTIVSEFLDVFPDELPGIPSVREVEFSIELIPGVEPISKAPYRMALIQLKELKDQLQ
nr:zinc finger, CCHC-type, retrotransposon Gag domain protein [Tanacetum cinerariifolium]